MTNENDIPQTTRNNKPANNNKNQRKERSATRCLLLAASFSTHSRDLVLPIVQPVVMVVLGLVLEAKIVP